MSEPSDGEELAELSATLKRHLERRQQAGLRYLPKASAALPKPHDSQ